MHQSKADSLTNLFFHTAHYRSKTRITS